MEIIERALAELIPYHGNPRKIPASSVRKVAASIQAFGWQQPIVVDENDIILIGHTRRKAAIELGLERVPVLKTIGLSESQKAALRLADNRAGEESTWDQGLLREELLAMDLASIDRELSGFDLPEIEELLRDDWKQRPVSSLEVVPLSSLKPHPRNYRQHPEDQILHLMKSIREYGIYRNIVITRDSTVLAGHGVLSAATRMKLEHIPVIRIDVDPNDAAALKLLAADNEVSHLAEVDDRKLTEMLKELILVDPLEGLQGTGFTQEMLAALALNTRPAGEVRDKAEAKEWVGMPEYDDTDVESFKLMVSFKTEEERAKFVASINLRIDKQARSCWATRYPWTDRDDTSSVRFTK